MFTDQLNENWESTANQDAFIKEYFSKKKVPSKSKQNKGIETGLSKKIPAVQKSKTENNEDDHDNFVSTSNQLKKKRPSSSESKLSKKLKKFLSSFEEDGNEISDKDASNEIEQSHTVDLNCHESKKQKKFKNKEKLISVSSDDQTETSNIKPASNSGDVKKEQFDMLEFKSQKSKRKKKLKNKNRTEDHLEDSVLDLNNGELERSATELSSKGVTKPHTMGVISNSMAANQSTVEEEQSDIADSKNRKSKKRKRARSKKKQALQEDFSNSHTEELEEKDELEVDSEAEEPSAVGGKLNTVSANKGSAFQNKIHQKLQAAKFRYLNEMLYKSPGQEALSYFQENSDEFEDYHTGYQSQVSKWPVNPVDIIIQEIRQMNKEAVIADLGCGAAKIAETFPKRTVHSFDLIALKDGIIACNMANVPLPSNSVDTAVFCLSLMGTNWKDYIRESHRLLKFGAVLKIAEIESRVDDVNLFIKNIERFGFSLENKDLSHKMFIFLNFKKTSKSKKNSKVPDVTLKPCLYKKR